MSTFFQTLGRLINDHDAGFECSAGGDDAAAWAAMGDMFEVTIEARDGEPVSQVVPSSEMPEIMDRISRQGLAGHDLKANIRVVG